MLWKKCCRSEIFLRMSHSHTDDDNDDKSKPFINHEPSEQSTPVVSVPPSLAQPYVFSFKALTIQVVPYGSKILVLRVTGGER